MITDEKYKEILENGLLLDHYLVLSNLSKGAKMVDSKRIQGFINLLIKKDYIEEGAITQKGLSLLETKVPPVEVKITELVTDFDNWIKSLHQKCIDKIEAATGKKNVTAKIKTSTYSFIPSRWEDLANPIKRFMRFYKVKDLDKIEIVILAYVQRCLDNKNYFPLLKYYIIKDGVSEMINDIDNFDEGRPEDYKSNTKLL